MLSTPATTVPLEIPTAYRPQPPIIPTFAIPTHSQSTSSGVHLSAGAIAGVVFGSLSLVVASVLAVFYFCSRKHRSRSSSNWQDLEGNDDKINLHNTPYEEKKTPVSSALDNYTAYSPRTEGRFSPVSQMVPATFGLIREHHLSSDPFADPGVRKETRQNFYEASVGNDIELMDKPLDAHLHR